MSDQNAGGADFRATDRRRDETVMVNADDLSNLVAEARQTPPPELPVFPPPRPPAAIPVKAAANHTVLIIVIVAAVILIGAVLAFLLL